MSQEQTSKESTDAQLLRVPTHFRSVEDVLGVAGKLDLPNVLVLAELENGTLVALDSDLTIAQTNWLLDCAKHWLMSASTLEPVGP